jgi:hypothetical protein
MIIDFAQAITLAVEAIALGCGGGTSEGDGHAYAME